MALTDKIRNRIEVVIAADELGSCKCVCMAEIVAIKHTGLWETIMPFVHPNPLPFPSLWMSCGSGPRQYRGRRTTTRRETSSTNHPHGFFQGEVQTTFILQYQTVESHTLQGEIFHLPFRLSSERIEFSLLPCQISGMLSFVTSPTTQS